MENGLYQHHIGYLVDYLVSRGYGFCHGGVCATVKFGVEKKSVVLIQYSSALW